MSRASEFEQEARALNQEAGDKESAADRLEAVGGFGNEAAKVRKEAAELRQQAALRLALAAEHRRRWRINMPHLV